MKVLTIYIGIIYILRATQDVYKFFFSILDVMSVLHIYIRKSFNLMLFKRNG